MALTPGTWADRVETFRRFEAENGNLTQVLTWCHGAGDAESGLRICVAMRPVWIVQGSFGEGAGWMDAFLDLDTSALADCGTRSRLWSAGLSWPSRSTRPMPPSARRPVSSSAEAPGLEFWAASALNLLAEVALHAGELAEADARAGRGAGHHVGFR